MKTMSKHVKGIFLLMLVAVVLVGCTQSEKHFCRSLVQEYRHNKTLEVAETYEGNDDMFEKTIQLYFVCDYSVDMLSEGAEKELYDSLCKQNNDMAYNREDRFIPDKTNFNNKCYFPDVAHIDVVSDADFDAEHPAGTSLNDCIELFCTSFYNYIANGYTGADKNNMTNRIEMPLSELTETSLPLIKDGHYWLEFTKLPDAEQVHTMTITFTDREGSVFTTTAQCDFRDIL